MIMKNIKLILVIAGLAGVLLTSCDKSETPDTTTSLSTLQADNAFSWTTAISVELKITGLPTVIPVSSTLTIALENGSVLFTRLHQMNQNLAINLIVPSDEKKLVLKYGSVSYPVDILANQANFSFIPVVVD
jgi:hypothetical protein